MSNTTSYFDVNFSVPATSGPTPVVHAKADVAAVLMIAAPGQPAVANELVLTLSVDSLGAPPLSTVSPTLIVLSLAGLVTPADAANIRIGGQDSDWTVSLLPGSATLHITRSTDLPGSSTEVTLVNVIASSSIALQPSVSLNGVPAMTQNKLQAVQQPQSGNKQLDGLNIFFQQDGVVPIGPADAVIDQTFSIIFDFYTQDSGPTLPVQGLVTVWFDTQDDTLAPRRGDLGCNTQVATKFDVSVGENYGNYWTPSSSLDAQPPTWMFQSDSTGLLPNGKAELVFKGSLGTKALVGPNLPGIANCYVMISQMHGYDQRIWVLPLTKIVALQSVDATFGQMQTFRQDSFTFAVDTTEVAAPFDGSLTVSEDSHVNAISFTLLTPPGQPPTTLFRGESMLLNKLTLTAPIRYQLSAEAGSALVERRAVELIGLKLVPQADLRLLVFPGADLRHCSLMNCNASKVDFSGAHLDNSDLSGVDSDLSGANFRNATLTGTKFNGANLCNVDFTGADLSSADFTGACLDMVQWKDALNLDQAIGVSAKSVLVWKVASRGAASVGSLRNVDLSKSQLSGASFVGCDVSGVDFTGSDLAGADFTDAVVENATMDSTALKGAIFVRAHLAGTRLDKGVDASVKWMVVSRLVTLGGSGIDDSNPQDLDFSDAYLGNINLSGLNLSGTNLQRTVLSGTSFGTCVLKNAQMGNAILTGSSLNQTQMAGAELGGATLDLVDFRGAVDLDKAVGLALKWIAVWKVVNGPPRISPLKQHLLPSFPLSLSPTPYRDDWSGTDFSNAQLCGAALYSCGLVGCNFEGAHFDSADLAGSNVDNASFKNADLTNVIFDWVDLSKTKDFDKALGAGKWTNIWNLQRAPFQDPPGPCPGASLANADLSFAYLQNINMGAMAFNGANLDYADLRGSYLDGCDFSDASMRFCQLPMASMSGVKSLEGANLDFIPWLNVGMRSAPQARADYVTACDMVNQTTYYFALSPAPVFYMLNFSGVNWQGYGTLPINAKFLCCIFQNAVLEGVDFSGAEIFFSDLGGARFYGSVLKGATFLGVSLEGADLRCADMTGADFRVWMDAVPVSVLNAIYNKETIWPTGFDPVASGARLVEY